MTTGNFRRRDLMKAGALATAGAAMLGPIAGAAQTAAASVAASSVYSPQPMPLPFDPKTIVGLSEKLLTSHHNNNYASAVKRIGAIGAQLAALDPATAPGFQLIGLKREELIAMNSMVLHEHYFAQFGTPNPPGAALARAIERDFGSEARWRAEFVGMGKAMGGGSGWVVLGWSPRDKRLFNQWAGDHTMTLAAGSPILLLDMYEHAYAMDYGAKAAAYVDAFMAAIDWRASDRRYAGVSA
jgi:Fe-Mn family superoxide dismutase